MPDVADGEAPAAAAEASKPSLPPLLLARLAARGIVKPAGGAEARGGNGGDRIGASTLASEQQQQPRPAAPPPHSSSSAPGAAPQLSYQHQTWYSAQDPRHGGLPYFFCFATGERSWTWPPFSPAPLPLPPPFWRGGGGGGGFRPPPPQQQQQHFYPPPVAVPATVPAAFEPCERFEGPRAGFCFKMGPSGLGYYQDGGGGANGSALAPSQFAPRQHQQQQHQQQDQQQQHYQPNSYQQQQQSHASRMAAERAAEQAARNAGRGRGRGRMGGGGGGGASGSIDPMDPASYSDAPVGGWSRGLDKA